MLRALLVAASSTGAAALVELGLRTGLVPNERHKSQELEAMWDTAPHRLLILGDSFIVPFGMLGRLLPDQLAPHGIAVRNLAVSGTGPFEYLERLEGFRHPKGPDLVLLSYYAGNDLTDVQDNPKYDKDARGVAINTLRGPAPAPPPPAGWRDRLYLAQFLPARRARAPVQEDAFPWKRFQRAGMDPEVIAAAQENRINPWLLKLALRNPDHLLDNVLRERPKNQQAWARSRELLDRIHQACLRRGARLLVMVFPRSIQLDDSHFEFFQKVRFRLDPRTIGSTRPQDQMREFCEERDIPMLDLMPVFQAHAGQQLYLEQDDHLNREGYQVAAQAILPFVQEHRDDDP